MVFRVTPRTMIRSPDRISLDVDGRSAGMYGNEFWENHVMRYGSASGVTDVRKPWVVIDNPVSLYTDRDCAPFPWTQLWYGQMYKSTFDFSLEAALMIRG